jgi:hypothetical protein
MRKIDKIFIAAAFVLTANLTLAMDFRVFQIPNGAKNGCLNCHISAAGGGNRNAFGTMVERKYLDAGGNVKWGPAMASEDPDGDGFTNGQELQDPNGTWKAGQPNPGTGILVTLPGDPASKPTATDIADLKMPVTYRLEQNYPNPFNPTTQIKFTLPHASYTQLRVFDIAGREISTLVNNNLSAGSYSVKFNAADLSSGIYFYRIQTNDFIDTKKFVLMK